MRSAGPARSLHSVKINDPSVTPDERSQVLTLCSHQTPKSAFLEVPFSLMSINRQVRLGDFLFTGE